MSKNSVKRPKYEYSSDPVSSYRVSGPTFGDSRPYGSFNKSIKRASGSYQYEYSSGPVSSYRVSGPFYGVTGPSHRGSGPNESYKRSVKRASGSSDGYGYSSSPVLGPSYGGSGPSYGGSGPSYGSSGPYGSFSSGGGMDCCPLVVDPLTLLSFVAFIGAATYLLNQVISMSNLAKRKKRSSEANLDIIFAGKDKISVLAFR